tara:strand:- start:1246 stop:2148 length:903 start_codon:yes stop_codon:yes gene_type:complete
MNLEKFLSINQLTISIIVMPLLMFFLPHVGSFFSMQEVSIIEFRKNNSAISDNWLPDHVIEYNFGKVKVDEGGVDVKYYMIQNESSKAIEKEDFVKAIQLNGGGILDIYSCSREYNEACSPKSVSYPESKWHKIDNNWQLEPLYIEKNEKICVIVVLEKKEVSPLLLFSGRVKGLNVKYYNSSAEYFNTKRKVLSFLRAFNLFNGRLVGVLVGMTTFLALLVLFSKAKVINHISSGDLLFIWVAGMAGLAVFGSIVNYYVTREISSNDFVMILLLLFLGWLSVHTSKRNNARDSNVDEIE